MYYSNNFIIDTSLNSVQQLITNLSIWSDKSVSYLLKMLRILLCLSFVLHCIANELETGLVIKRSFQPNKLVFNLMDNKLFVKSLFENQLFMDKSLLIKDIVDDENDTYLITCPRRWGKSVNMNMIKVFFEMQMNAKGEPIPLPESPNYRLFINGEVIVDSRIKKLRNPLLIAKHQRIVDEHLGKWPLIYVSLSDTFDANSSETIVAKFGECISSEFLRYNYVTKVFLDTIDGGKSDDIKADAQERLELFEYFTDTYHRTKWNRGKIERSVLFLSETLHQYFKKKVFILLDDYFTPWEILLAEKNVPESDREKFDKFYVNFLGKTFKKNPHLQKGIVTGIYPPIKELHETSFSNVTECNMITGKFMEYYGFHRREVEALFNFLNVTDNTREEITQWYNGYKVNNRDIHIYNPWSVVSYFNEKKFDTFWINTGCVRTLLQACFEINIFNSEFKLLLDGAETMIEKEKLYFTRKEYEEITQIWVHQYRSPIQEHHCTDKAFMFLHFHGYLTLAEDTGSNFMFYRMKFPNEEIISPMRWKCSMYADVAQFTKSFG